MSESETPEPQPQQSERILRIKKESKIAESVLHAIESNPERAYQAEREIMRTIGQSELLAFLRKRTDSDLLSSSDSMRDQYVRGALASFRMLRLQADRDHVQLPIISQDIVRGYLADNDEVIRDEQAGRGFLNIRDIGAGRLSELDEGLARAIRSLPSGENERAAMLFGAYDVSNLLNKALAIREDEEKLRVTGMTIGIESKDE